MRSTPTPAGHDIDVRDDLFTHIHKALRLGIFDLTVQLGRTDWFDTDDVIALGARWRPLLELLRAHTEHEDAFIFRLLDDCDLLAVEPLDDGHRDLDDLLDDLAERFELVLSAPDATAGLELYRDMARFVAVYLQHLHEEETRIMSRIWELCSDQKIAETRTEFMAATPPSVQATSLRYLIPAIDQPTRRELVRGLAAAPHAVVAGIFAIAQDVLSPAEFADLQAVAASVPA